MKPLQRLLTTISRKKILDQAYLRHSDWLRCIGIFDMIGLALGAGLAPTVFVLIPEAVRTVGGQGAAIGVLIAFIVSLITSFHYVELCQLVPKCGGLYSTSYVVFGELFAFLIGWLTIVDYWIVTALMAKHWSQHLNYLFNKSIYAAIGYNSSTSLDHNLLDETIPILDSSPDYAAIIVVLLSGLLCLFGMRVACLVVLIFMIVSCLILFSVLMLGFFYANTHNMVPSNVVSFLAPSVAGSRVIVGFLGTEVLVFLMEEVLNPQKHHARLIPAFPVTSLFVTFPSCVVLSLMVPFHQLPITAVLPKVYGAVSVPAAKYVLSVGSVCGLFASVVCLSMPALRVLHEMGKDGLLCQSFAYLSKSSSVAIAGSFLSFVVHIAFICINSAFLSQILYISVPLRLVVCICLVLCIRFGVVDFVVLEVIQNSTKSYSHLKQRSRCIFTDESFSTIDKELSFPDSILKVQSFPGYSSISLSVPNSLRDPACEAYTNDSLSRETRENGSVAESGFNNNNNRNMVNSSSFATYESLPGLSLQQETINSEANESNYGHHNCLQSPCNSSIDLQGDADHIFKQEIPELPYANVFHPSATERSLASVLNWRQKWKLPLFLGMFLVISVVFSCVLVRISSRTVTWYALLALGGLMVLIVAVVIIIARLQQKTIQIKHKVPLVPFLSLLALHFLLYLLVSSITHGWIKLAAVLGVGLLVYLAFGIRRSIEGRKRVESKLEEIGEKLHKKSGQRMQFINSSSSQSTNLSLQQK